MNILIIPVSPLPKSKSRLNGYFSREQLEELTTSMLKDFGDKLNKINCFDEKIVYCNSTEVLDLAEELHLTGIKEEIGSNSTSLDDVVSSIICLVKNDYKAEQTLISFIDLVLINSNNLLEISNLLKENQLVVCPAARSAGISILGGNPPDMIPPCFSDPSTPSLFKLISNANKRNIKKIAIYDSFTAGFDMDIKEDCVLALEYLKIYNLTNTETFKFLNANVDQCIEKEDRDNNRVFKIVDK